MSTTLRLPVSGIEMVSGACEPAVACHWTCSRGCLFKFSGNSSSKFTYSPRNIRSASLVGTAGGGGGGGADDGRMQEEVVELATSEAGPGRPDGGPRSWSAAPGGGAQFASVGASCSVMLAGADVDVVDVDVVDVGPRRRSISSITVDAMRAESSWVSVTGACSAEGGIDGGPSLYLDPRVALSVLFSRRDVREVRRPRVEDMTVFTEQG